MAAAWFVVARRENSSPKLQKTLTNAANCSTVRDLINTDVPKEFDEMSITRIFGKTSPNLGDETELSSGTPTSVLSDFGLKYVCVVLTRTAATHADSSDKRPWPTVNINN